MVDYVKSSQQEGYDIHDYTAIPFTATISPPYIVGTNMYGTLLILQPNVDLNPKLKALRDNPDTGIPGFTAHKVRFFPTQDCYVYMIQPGMLLTTRLPVFLPANDYHEFDLKVCVIYVVRHPLAQNGTLECWFQG